MYGKSTVSYIRQFIIDREVTSINLQLYSLGYDRKQFIIIITGSNQIIIEFDYATCIPYNLNNSTV